MTAEKLGYFFTGFCPVSGSPVTPFDQNRYEVTVNSIAGGTATGLVHLCCWPCSCDTSEHIFTDTKTITTSEGDFEFNMLVIGDPCIDPSKIPPEAPDVSCDA